MQKKLVLMLLVLSLGSKSEKSVITLTETTFSEFIETNPKVLINFFTPVCGHCVVFEPQMKELAKRIKKIKSPIKIAEVDCSVSQEVVRKYALTKYPTVLYFINGEPIEYKGDREENDIFNWLEKKGKGFSTEIKDIQDLKKMKNFSLGVFFSYPEGDRDGLENFFKFARDYDHVAFGHSSNQEMKDNLKIKEKYAFTIFKNGEKMKLKKNEILTKEELKQFFENNRYDLVQYWDQDLAERVFVEKINTLFCFTNSEETQEYKWFENLAETNRDNFLFAHATLIAGLGKKMAEFFNVNPENQTTLRIMAFNDGKIEGFYVDSTSEDSLQRSLHDFLKGNSKPFYTTEV